MNDSINTLRDTILVMELAEKVVTPSIRRALLSNASETLTMVASTLESREPESREPESRGPESKGPESKGSESRGSLYTQFISEMSAAAKKALPQKLQKERLFTLASLWTRYKCLGDLEEIMAAAKKDLQVARGLQTPVVTVDISA